jgi:hypothetical protein
MEDTQAAPSAGPVTDTPAVFDREKPFPLKLTRQKKSVVVRFPTDDELARRERRVRTFKKSGTSQQITEGVEEAHLEFARSLRISGDEIDLSISDRVSELILRVVPEPPIPVAEGYEISMEVMIGYQTRHTLREPTEAEMRKHEENAIWLGPWRYRRQEVRVVLSEYKATYDKLCKKVEGYSGGAESVPSTHKAMVVTALINQIREEEEGDVDPTLFQNPSGQKS